LNEHRNLINGEIAEYFQRFRFPRNESRLSNFNWLKDFATQVFMDNDTIVSLNYDCFLEGLLDRHRIWTPAKGYACIEGGGLGSSVGQIKNPKNIMIYKIHGSENFHTCGMESPDIDHREIDLPIDPDIYPESGKNSHIGVGDHKPYIIAPSFVKIPYPQIRHMIVEAINAACIAKNFIIIGCGLRPEDPHLWLLLTGFIYHNPNHKKIIIIDLKPDHIKEKIETEYRYVNNLRIELLGKENDRGLNEYTVGQLIQQLTFGCAERNR
jgi:hypothetical protein